MTTAPSDHDPYKILQVDPSAEAETIAAAYRSLAKRFHPDTNPGPGAGDRMQEINWAYNLLGDPEKRAAFDRERAERVSGYSPFTSPSGAGSTAETSFSHETVVRAVNEALRQARTTCQICGDVAPTRKVRFDRNTGMIFMRQHRVVESRLCRRCIEETFWQFTGKMLLFGWWGAISFFVTWIYLFGNLISYLRSLTLEPQGDGLWKTALGWKLLTLSVIALVIWVIMEMVH